MAILFEGKYPPLYDSLQNETMVLENQTSLSTNVEEIDSEFAGIIVMLDELCGEYADELKNSIGSIVTEAKIICDTIINGLESTLGEVQNLSDNLGTFKEDDETCEEKLDELKSTKAKLETSTAQDTIKNIKNKIFNIQNAIKSYKKLLEKDRDQCDNNIGNIEDFNDSIVDMRLKMASIASVSEGISPEELAKLTPEEREAYVKSIVDKMTERYEEYKAAYENFVDQMANSDDIDVLRDFYGLIYGDTGTYVDSSNYVNCGMWYYDFFQKLCVPDYALPDNMSPLDIIRRYQDTGDLEGSGMVDLLALGLENQGFYDDWRDKREQVDEYLAIAVDSFNTYRDEPISVDDYLRSVTKGAADLEVWSSGFYGNYKSALKVGIATQGLKELQGHARYDSYYLLEAFQNYDDSKWSDEAFMQSLCDSTDIDMDRLAYMSQSEVKTFRYLYDREGEAAAQEFLNSISPTLNRREGYIKASIYYNQVMSGSNEGLEAAWDHFCVGGKGYGDGLSYFLDGFVDCVAPSREMSANEYAQVALLGYLTEGGTDYDTSLLAAYNIGKTMGEETIPTILDLIRPGLGKASKMISNYGNSVETYIRADESTTYGEAYAHAAVDLATDKWLDVVGSGADSVGSKFAFALFKNLVKSGRDSIMSGEELSASDLYTSSLKTAEDNLTGQASSYVSDNVLDLFNGYIDSCGWPDGFGKKEVVKALGKVVIPSTSKEAIKAAKKSNFGMGASSVMDPYDPDNYFGNSAIGHEADFAP